MSWLACGLFLFILQVLVVLLLEYKEPYKLTAWLFILFIVPFLGFVFYLIAARDYEKRKRATKEDGVRIPVPYKRPDPVAEQPRFRRYARFMNTIDRLPVYPPTEAAGARIYTEAAPFYEELLRDMKAARHHIHIQFYIFRDDEVGRRFTDLMTKKAVEGVEVRCIVDGIGSLRYPRDKIRELQRNGVQFHIFLPPVVSLLHKRINYRNHRKIVVCDGRVGYLGGMNIGLEHLGLDDRYGNWRDTQMRIAGQAVYGLQHTFLRDWQLVAGEDMTEDSRYYPDMGEADATYDGQLMQLIQSGPDQAENAMFSVFFGMMAAAERSIYVTTPYFIPEESISMALKSAALSGLDVRIIIPGRADSRIAKLATLSHLEELMRAGVRVYEYQNGFIHAKTVIVDSSLATVGTANMDMRSFFSNFEMNAVVYAEPLVRQLEENFRQDLRFSRELKYQAFRERTVWQRVLEAGARMVSPLF